MEPVVQMKGIVKEFPGVKANDNIDLLVMPGEIHALLGENGAGKSTLMNILYGLYQPDAGQILIKGKEVKVTDPNVAIGMGVGMVHQHFMLIPPFSVAENIILGTEPQKRGLLDMDKAIRQVREISEQYGLMIDPLAKVQDISVGMQQRVEIIKALFRGADILILDEPTAVLTPQEIDELEKIMRGLVDQGKSIILITHKLKEVMSMSDKVTVIRRGKVVANLDTDQTNEEELASTMVGRPVLLEVEKGAAQPGDPILEVRGLHAKDSRDLPALNGINLTVRSGEILGLAGVDGNGQSELIEVLTGLRQATEGTILLNGTDITGLTPRKKTLAGIGHIPEDRQKRGLVLEFSVAENLILQSYFQKPLASGIQLNGGAIHQYSQRLIEEFDIRTPDDEVLASHLSGGNQQKVIVAREIDRNPDLLIAAQPTRGLDVGAIEFVHKKLVQERDAGKAVLLISLELDEVLSLSDRIAVIYEGKIVAVLEAGEATEEQLGLLMSGASAGKEVTANYA